MNEAINQHPYHHGHLRAALLEQAVIDIRERGSDGLSLRDLARQVGVSHAAPRRHFPDRQALLDALAEEGYQRLGSEFRAALDTVGTEFEPRLRAIATAYTRFATEDAALLELMFSRKYTSGHDVVQIAAYNSFDVLIPLILQGQAEGLLQPGEPERVGLLIFATIQGVASLLTSGMIGADQLEGLLSDAITSFLIGQSRRA